MEPTLQYLDRDLFRRSQGGSRKQELVIGIYLECLLSGLLPACDVFEFR